MLNLWFWRNILLPVVMASLCITFVITFWSVFNTDVRKVCFYSYSFVLFVSTIISLTYTFFYNRDLLDALYIFYLHYYHDIVWYENNGDNRQSNHMLTRQGRVFRRRDRILLSRESEERLTK